MRHELVRTAAAVLGVLFAGTGVAQSAAGLSLVQFSGTWASALAPDPLDGFVLAVIGVIFLTGVRSPPADHGGLVAHSWVGAALAIGFGLLSLVVALSGAADLLLAGEAFTDPFVSIGPALILAVPAALLYFVVRPEPRRDGGA
ncbi:hypothetical protein DSECCO2_398860 [anaerobic digester metagenome]